MANQEDHEQHRHLLGGIRIDSMQRRDLFDIVKAAVSLRKKTLVLNHNLHSLYLYTTTLAFRSLYQIADWVYIDGMPVVWLGKAAGLPISPSNRVTLLDCFEDLMRDATEHKWRVYYLGGTPEVLSKGLTHLRHLFPKLEIAGRDGYFCTGDAGVAERAALLVELEDYKPDVLLVGMGMPLQEEWLACNYADLEVPVVLTCGATLSYVTGEAYRPPAWAGPLGLYGVMRMFAEPSRLWRRYLVEPLLLARRLGPQIALQRFRALPSWTQ